MLEGLEESYSPNQILISYAMDEYPDVGGSTVWVRRHSSPDPRWYDVWYSPDKDKWHCLDTPPLSWDFWGTMDNNMNTYKPEATRRGRARRPKVKAKPGNTAAPPKTTYFTWDKPKEKTKGVFPKAKSKSMKIRG